MPRRDRDPDSPMPARWRAFAAGVARGVSRHKAFLAAGFAPHHSGAIKLEKNPRVAARIAELSALEARIAGAGLSATVIALLADAAHARLHGGPACLREVRQTLIAATELQRLAEAPVAAAATRPRELTDEEWGERFGADGRQR